MKALLATVVVSSLQILACQRNSQGPGLCAGAPTAVAAATDLLAKEGAASQYQVSQAYALEEPPDKWIVVIRRVTAPGEVVAPAAAEIEVKKANCRSRRLLAR